ncbi:hypothetical protein M4I21_15600 [Cellulophaga sp. 20_2_10]|uniref:hypothetical protein n=1 Tax=Cellulophaga sp. 20_2_10 TaxID=2942476 RepID=UPI00201B1E84|nr:hypothetical protein [Cellulophaga sp. 20_2_10]MCL5247247.1 hypothetical protein [Cellulophaga sp. 20_2_10]
MKAKNLLIAFCVLLFNSCVLKSLHPFYVSSAIFFEKSFTGNWVDSKNGKWDIVALNDEFKKEKEPMSEEDKKMFQQYKDGYFIKYVEDKKEATFIGIPFKVNNQLFIDFNLFEFDTGELNNLVKSNIIETHTVAKLELLNNGSVSLKWLDEDRLSELFEKNQIQLKHEKVGINKTLVLTGSSKELYKFLKKYLDSDIKNKWETDKKFTLTRANETP